MSTHMRFTLKFRAHWTMPIRITYRETLKPGGEYSLALVRRTNLPGYYNLHRNFYDEVSLQKSSIWDQGAAMGLDKLLVVVEDAENEEDGYKKSRGDIIRDFKQSKFCVFAAKLCSI